MQTELRQEQFGRFRIDDVGRYERDGVTVTTRWRPVDRDYATVVWCRGELSDVSRTYGTDRAAAVTGHADAVRQMDHALDARQYVRVSA